MVKGRGRVGSRENQKRIEGNIGNSFAAFFFFFSAEGSKDMGWEVAEKMESKEGFLGQRGARACVC